MIGGFFFFVMCCTLPACLNVVAGPIVVFCTRCFAMPHYAGWVMVTMDADAKPLPLHNLLEDDLIRCRKEEKKKVSQMYQSEESRSF